MKTIYLVTYVLLFPDGKTKEFVEKFSYYPSPEDLKEVGYELCAQHNACNFVWMRKKEV